jgi:hypothetical protein
MTTTFMWRSSRSTGDGSADPADATDRTRPPAVTPPTIPFSVAPRTAAVRSATENDENGEGASHARPILGLVAVGHDAASSLIAGAPPHRVDAAHAHRVAQAFLAAPRWSPDPLVRAAYDELASQANRLFDRFTGASARRPVRVALTRCPEPYRSARDLSEQVRTERVLELAPCRLDHDRRPPLLDASIGGAYDRFRAVHDIVSHGLLGYGFDRDGEFSAWLVEDGLYTGLARRALATELHAEHSVRWTTGEIADHKAAILPVGLVAAGRAGARRRDAASPGAPLVRHAGPTGDAH